MRSTDPYLILAAFCLALWTPVRVGAQDNQLWSSIGVDVTWASRFNLELEQQLRLKEQISTFKNTFTEISLAYKISKSSSASSNYRYLIYPDKRRRRISLSGRYARDLTRLSLGYRLKIQRETEAGESPEDRVRNRLALSYRLTPGLSSYLEMEAFHQDDEGEYEYRKYRLTWGFKKKLTKVHSLKGYIRYQEEVNVADPARLLIWGARYQISL